MGRLGIALLLLAGLVVMDQVQGQREANATEALLSLPAACSNWETATAAVPGAPWAAGTPPCGNASAAAWRGVTCSAGGNVTELRLPGLGLAGTLPPALAGLEDLQVLDLSFNKFLGSISPQWLLPGSLPSLAHANLSSNLLSGSLPAQMVLLARHSIRAADCRFKGSLPTGWRSATLHLLDLSDNELTHILPAEWGEKTALPALSELFLQGNNIRGPIPDPQWTSVGLNAPCTFQVRPGNQALCGQLLALAPELYDPAIIQNPILAANFTMPKPQQGLLSNVTTLIVTQTGLFSPNSTVTITNTLGSCALPCSGVVGFGPATATITTNFYDLTWQANVSASDLLALNPGGAAALPGASLKMPCYPPDNGPVNAVGLSPKYFGSDVAYLRFAGGNQKAGLAGQAGAMAASGTNDHPPNANDFDFPYVGSTHAWVAENGSMMEELVQPVYLFVDLQAEFQVSSVVLTAGFLDLRNASIYIGSNTSAVMANTRVASGITVAPKQSVAVAAGGASGRFVIVYTGMAEEGQMSVSDFQVYAVETNAAANKEAAVSGLELGSTETKSLVDNDNNSCLDIEAAPAGNTAWAAVDLGYQGTVGSVSVFLGPGLPAGTFLRAYVKPHGMDASVTETQACSNAGVEVPTEGGWAAMPCNATGRVIVVSVPATQTFKLCELQVSLTQRPSAAYPGGDDSPGTSSLSGGAIAGIVIGCAAAVAVVVLLLVYCVRRKRLQRRWRHAAASKADQVGCAPAKDVLDSAERGGGASSNACLGTAHSGSEVVAAIAVAAVDNAPPATVASGGSAGSNAQHASPSSTVSGTLPLSPQPSLAEASTTDLSKLPQGFNDVSASEFQLVRAIGEGSFGQVWVARYYATTVAVKMLTHPQKEPSPTSSVQQATLLRNLHREAGLMSRLRHPNVCQYLGACSDPPCLLMELCAKRSIDTVLAGGLTDPKVAKQLSWGRLLSMALDAAKGMLYLHSRTVPIVHRDLKSANLLVDSQWHVKVADFNMSKEAGGETRSSLVSITNPRWLAPEVLTGHPGQQPADVWAFGTVLWEIATWRVPFEGMNPFQIITKVQTHPDGSGLAVPAPEELPAGPFPGWLAYIDLMQACWRRTPAERPKFDAVVEALRALLSAELKRQQQLQRGRSSGNPSLEVPGTPSAAAADGVAAGAAASSAPFSASSSALPASRASSAAAEQAAAQVPGAGAPGMSAAGARAAGQVERLPSRGLDAASPFAAASRKELAPTPSDGPP